MWSRGQRWFLMGNWWALHLVGQELMSLAFSKSTEWAGFLRAASYWSFIASDHERPSNEQQGMVGVGGVGGRNSKTWRVNKCVCVCVFYYPPVWMNLLCTFTALLLLPILTLIYASSEQIILFESYKFFFLPYVWFHYQKSILSFTRDVTHIPQVSIITPSEIVLINGWVLRFPAVTLGTAVPFFPHFQSKRLSDKQTFPKTHKPVWLWLLQGRHLQR